MSGFPKFSKRFSPLNTNFTIGEGKEGMVSEEKGVPNLQGPDLNHQVRAGQQDLDHQGCDPERKLYEKS